MDSRKIEWIIDMRDENDDFCKNIIMCSSAVIILIVSFKCGHKFVDNNE